MMWIFRFLIVIRGAVRAKILRYSPKIFALAEVTPSPRPSPSGRGRSDASHPASAFAVSAILLSPNGAQASEAIKTGDGLQGDMLGATSIYVLPSTSRSANGYWDVSYWREIADRILAFGV